MKIKNEKLGFIIKDGGVIIWDVSIPIEYEADTDFWNASDYAFEDVDLIWLEVVGNNCDIISKIVDLNDYPIFFKPYLIDDEDYSILLSKDGALEEINKFFNELHNKSLYGIVRNAEVCVRVIEFFNELESRINNAGFNQYLKEYYDR
jgi:hypothetical protein